MTDTARRRPSPLSLAGMGAVLLLYLLYPFASFLARTGRAEAATLADPRVREAVLHSLATAPVATAVATVLGVPLAYTLSRNSFRGQRLVEALVVLPLVLPPVVAGAMLLTGYGRFTLVGTLAASVGVRLTDSLVGVVLAQTFVAAPFIVITARAGFDGVDPRLERASRSMGHGPLVTFRHVSLPLARGAIFAGIVLTFARAIGEFGATMMVAYNPRTMPTRIWVDFVTGGLDAVVPVALLLVAVGVGALIPTQLLDRRAGWRR